MIVPCDDLSKRYLDRIKGAYLNLQQKHPNHDLLSLATIDSTGNTIELSEKYSDLFVDPRDEIGTFGQVRYAKALEEALEF